MRATIKIDEFGRALSDYIISRLIPQAGETSTKFALGVFSALAPRIVAAAAKNKLAGALDVVADDGETVHLEPLREAVDAGIKASGGLEITLPMAARIRLSQDDADDFFERLG